jgi:hypothetical protein
MQTKEQIAQNASEIQKVIEDMGWNDANDGVNEFIRSYVIKNLDKSERVIVSQKNEELEKYLNGSRFNMYK